MKKSSVMISVTGVPLWTFLRSTKFLQIEMKEICNFTKEAAAAVAQSVKRPEFKVPQNRCR